MSLSLGPKSRPGFVRRALPNPGLLNPGLQPPGAVAYDKGRIRGSRESPNLRYIGSKARIASMIMDVVETTASSDTLKFLDLFAGSGAVSREAVERGWSVRSNDHLRSASILTTASLASTTDVPFESLGGYRGAIAELAEAVPASGFIYREYSPSGLSASGHLRQYFTEDNARRIDGCRRQIAEWVASGCLTPTERDLLLGDLLIATSCVANTAGTFGCFLRKFMPNAIAPLTLRPRTLVEPPSKFSVTCSEAFEIEAIHDEVAYLDPPYTKRQYAAYYHILETIAEGDEPKVGGITGLRPWKEHASDFCYKKRALDALLRLVAGLASTRIFISYSSEGHITLADLTAGLRRFGLVRLHRLSAVARYSPNLVAAERDSLVTEYLLELRKTPL